MDGHHRPSEGTGGRDADGYYRLDALLGEATATPDRIWCLFDVIEYPMSSLPSGYQPAARPGGEWVADRREERRQLKRMQDLQAAAGVDVAGGSYILHSGLIGPARDGPDALPSYWWPAPSWHVARGRPVRSRRRSTAPPRHQTSIATGLSELPPADLPRRTIRRLRSCARGRSWLSR